MICFIDFETTGIDVFRDEPVEFGAVLVDSNLNIKNEFLSRISIQKNVYLTKRALNIHQLSFEDLVDAPNQKEVVNQFFKEFGTDYKLAGWNTNFDVSFLRKMCHKSGMMIKYNKINYRHIDIQSLAHLAVELGLVKQRNTSLDDWVNFFGYNRRDNHSALEDAKLTFLIYKELLSVFRANIIKDIEHI